MPAASSISPKFGGMWSSPPSTATAFTLGDQGWKDIQKHTMLPLRIAKDQVTATLHDMMDKGVFKHHLRGA